MVQNNDYDPTTGDSEKPDASIAHAPNRNGAHDGGKTKSYG